MPENQCKQALFAFNGDVYQGLKADDFDPGDVKFSQDHLRILSGLYAVSYTHLDVYKRQVYDSTARRCN